VYKTVTTNRFEKDFQKAIKRGKDIEKLKKVMRALSEGKALDPKYRDHPLKGKYKYKDHRECHIEPDWLLIYKIDRDKGLIIFERTGTHSDLFG
jgi:mRNA interferase YafQ